MFRFISVVSVACILLVIPTASNAQAKRYEVHIPRVDQIEQVKIEAHQHIFGKPNVEPESVPVDVCKDILKFFEDSELDSDPALEMYEIGCARITLHNGEVMRYCWYWYVPSDTLCFSWNGVRFRSKPRKGDPEIDPAWALDGLVRRIAENARREVAERK